MFFQKQNVLVTNSDRSEDVDRLPSVSDNVCGQLLEQYFDTDLALLLKRLTKIFAGTLDCGRISYVDYEAVSEIVEMTKRN